MNIKKINIENFVDRLDDKLERICEVSQVVMGVMIIVCILVEVVAWLFMGRIKTLGGLIVAAIFVILGWNLSSAMTENFRKKNNDNEN